MKYHLPVYLHSANYAKEFQETIDYRASFRLNLQCRDAICEAIDAHYRNDRLDEAAVREVVEQFGYERTMVVLANTVRMKDWDRRFSPDKRKWADTIPCPCDMLGERGRQFLADKVHPGLVDLFITQVRKDYEREHKPSVKAALKDNALQTAVEPKPRKAKEPER